MDKKETPVLYPYPYPYHLHDSTFNRAYATTTAIFAILGEWMILVITFSITLFFIPLTPSFTLHSTTSSVLNFTAGKNFTANLAVHFLAEDSNPIGSTIQYDSLHFSLFHQQQRLSSFSPPPRSLYEPANKILTQAKFPNVSVMVDEWSVMEDHHGTSCGFVYLDLWFTANARYEQLMWPVVRDRIEGHCGDVKVEMCSGERDHHRESNVVVNSLLASCDVYSDVVGKIRRVLFVVLVVLVFLLTTAVAVPILIEHFFCSSMFS